MMGMAETKNLANTIEHLCREDQNEGLIGDNLSKLINDIKKAQIELNEYVE